MLPPPAAAMSGAKARQTQNTPVRLTSMVSCHSAGSISATDPNRATAAVFTKAVTGPCSSQVRAAA